MSKKNEWEKLVREAIKKGQKDKLILKALVETSEFRNNSSKETTKSNKF